MKKYTINKDFDYSKLDYPNKKKSVDRKKVVTLSSGCKVYFLKYFRNSIVYQR
jgi:hypothetical protein